MPENGSRILLKLENENPTGSMKDRMALAMIEAAEADGRLTADGSVVEYTGGSTGVSLSLVCAVKGYPLHIVTSDAFAREKLKHMEILGAKLQIVPSESGRMTEKLTRDMIEAARVVAEETGSLLDRSDEQSRPVCGLSQIGGGDLDSDRRADRWLCPERGHRGVSSRHRGSLAPPQRTRSRIVAVEPAESAVLSGGQPGAHKIDGIGAGFVVPLWQESIADQIERVSTEEAVAMALRLAREEGLFAGTSTGGNVIAALRLAEADLAPARPSSPSCATPG